MLDRNVWYRSLALLMLCMNIILTFTLIYLALDFLDLGRIVEHRGGQIFAPLWFDQLTRTMYFSSITLFSVGYGDMTPYHWARIVAVVEATVGYILPAVITVQYLQLYPSLIERWLPNRRK
ncbi:potassium channel family protein [Tuberibacillus sp. Marseille-P3662]|uniref:potassium channel family protein n=1 Tax=Tuberibacillus sp. Marseille-P3662 TaxID=1965358 RepID=UPI001593BF97|nr:potassium channel family protein [Tuberibacillus sp. Marseille-P3662]